MALMQTPSTPMHYPTVGQSVYVGSNPVMGYNQQQPPFQAAQGPDVTGLIESTGKAIFSPSTGSSLLPTGAANVVDKAANSLLGIGTVKPIQGAVQPGAAALGNGIEGGLSSNFTAGNAAGGLLGGFAANAVFGGGVGTNIGSTLGGIAGSFGGPVGSAIGSFIGGGIGSMFGKKKPSNKLQVGGINMATGEYDQEGSKLFSQSGKKYSDANAKTRDAYSMATADMVKYLRENGAQQNGEFGNLVIRVGDRSGLDYFFEKPVTSTETVDFRGSARNAELLNMQDSERNIQSFGKDAAAFGEGLQNGVLEKFNATPEQIKAAKELFNARLAELGGSTGTAQGKPISAPIPMIAGRKPTNWDDFMMDKLAKEQAPAKEPVKA